MALGRFRQARRAWN